MFGLQVLDPGADINVQSSIQSTIHSTIQSTVKRLTSRSDIAKFPAPEIHLRGPPVLSTTTQLQGTLNINLPANTNKYLKEICLKLEASAITWACSTESPNRQKKRIYIERQTLWRQNGHTILSDSCHSFDFIFAMPPAYLPPSFHFSSRIYIQYRVKAVAVFEQGKRKSTCDLVHNPIQVPHEENWGLAAAQNWIVIQPGISTHAPSPLQTKTYSKIGATISVKNSQPRKLSIRDRLRGRRLYPIRLEAMYIDSGVLANKALDSIQIQLVREELPLIQLCLNKVTVALTTITKVSVKKMRFVDRSNTILLKKIINRPLGAEVAVDITELIGPIHLPSVVSSFHTKTLSRSYKMVICCEVMAGDITSEMFIVFPICIYGGSNDGLLPAYQEIELPGYSEVLPTLPPSPGCVPPSSA